MGAGRRGVGRHGLFGSAIPGFDPGRRRLRSPGDGGGCPGWSRARRSGHEVFGKPQEQLDSTIRLDPGASVDRFRDGAHGCSGVVSDRKRSIDQQPHQRGARGRLSPHGMVAKGGAWPALLRPTGAVAVLVCICACGAAHPPPARPASTCWQALCRTMRFSLGVTDYGRSILVEMRNPTSQPIQVPRGKLVLLLQRRISGAGCAVIGRMAQRVEAQALAPGAALSLAFSGRAHLHSEVWASIYLTADGSPWPVPDGNTGWSAAARRRVGPVVPCPPRPLAGVQLSSAGTSPRVGR